MAKDLFPNTTPLGANSKAPTSAMSIVDSFMRPQQHTAVTSDLFEQQRQQIMDRLSKLQTTPAYVQRLNVASPPSDVQPKQGSY